MAKLKMVSGKTYSCPSVFGDRTVVRNDVVEVTDAQAQHLMQSSYFDGSNNEHFYFEESDDALHDGSAAPVPERAPATTAKTKAAARTRRAG
jgi:hypothetical protein